MGTSAPIELWLEFIIVYSVVIVLMLWLAIRYIRPVRRRSKDFDMMEQNFPSEDSGNEGKMEPQQ